MHSGNNDRDKADEIPLFQHLPDDVRESILSVAHRKAVARGSVFFHEDDDANGCHLLIEGRVKVVQTTAEGHQVVVRFVGPGEVFGWPAILGAPVYPGSAEAVTESVALVWDAATLSTAMQKHAQLALNALEILGGRLREAQSRLREMATERVERRVARALLRLARKGSHPAASGIEIGFPLSRQDLAEMTGATLHTVSRILAAWEQQGIVGGSRQRVVINSPEALEHLAED